MPELPQSSDVDAVADRLSGPDGPAFLKDVTTESWDDGGRSVADLLIWIPQTAKSVDGLAPARAGQSAHAIARFLADERGNLIDAPPNPALWQAFAAAPTPYLGAMVGDEHGVRGFAPLDGLDSQMRRTRSLFAAIAPRAAANTAFSAAASQRAAAYEAAFAKQAVADPPTADSGNARQDLLRAAHLRGLSAGSAHLVDPGSDTPTPVGAQTQVAFEAATLTARPGDPHIDSRFFDGGRLWSPADVADADWSVFDALLTVYLAVWPQIEAAIAEFGRTYSLVADG